MNRQQRRHLPITQRFAYEFRGDRRVTVREERPFNALPRWFKRAIKRERRSKAA